jgi:signal peptidase I
MADTPRQQTGFLFRYTLQSFGIIVLLAILIRTFIFSSYAMSGTSMLPTIWPGDFLLASKVRVTELKRGDVVAMRCPQIREKLCLKRVVALPGDRVEFHQGHLTINGQRAQHLPAGPFETEVVAGGSWAVWPAKEPHAPPAVVVPPQNLYLLNDKRADREDSRTWGPVAEDFLEARILRVWMSLDWYDGEKVRSWPRIRWTRLLRSID